MSRQKKLDQALGDVIEKGNREQLFDALWKYGVLNRLCPTDEEEKQARVTLKKVVWPGHRNDQEVYWRILYSAGAAREALKRGHTVVAPGLSFIGGTMYAFYQAVYSNRASVFFPELDQNKNPSEGFIEELIKRAKNEIVRHGGIPHQELIPWGSKGKFNGEEVTVERYTNDGLIQFEGKSGGVLPSQLNPEEFK